MNDRDLMERVHDNVYRIATPLPDTETQVYLVRGRQTALVDSGTADSVPERIEPALRALGLTLGDVDLVINTHPHWDHAGGNARIRAAGRAQVLLHTADRPFTAGPEAFLGSQFDISDIARTLGRHDLVSARRDLLRSHLGESMQVDRWLVDGERIDLGRGAVLEVVHTPGHTAGSVSLYWQGEGLLFTGDSAQGLGASPGGLPFYFHADDYQRSLSRLRELSVATLCLGHGFRTAGYYNSAVRRGRLASAMLEESLAVARKIDAAVQAAVAAGAPVDNLLEFGRVVVNLLQYDLPLQLDRNLGLPLATLATIRAHLRPAPPAL
jgi:glyoxylase-like metal-dependent hydrolase (beta-lactamase superfamily II)